MVNLPFWMNLRFGFELTSNINIVLWKIFQALFLIATSGSPSVREPSLWSSVMKDFLSKCVAVDTDLRWTAKQLLAVIEIFSEFCVTLIDIFSTHFWTKLVQSLKLFAKLWQLKLNKKRKRDIYFHSSDWDSCVVSLYMNSHNQNEIFWS